jgi:hypothetical protein
MSRAHASYSADVKAQAIARAYIIGGNEAADELHLPRRTVHNWLHSAAAPAISEVTRARIEDVLWQSFRRAVDVLAGALGTPEHPPQNLKLGDIARTVETLLRSYQLLTGGPTKRLEITTELFPDITPAEREVLVAFGRATEAWGRRLADAGLLEAYQAEHDAVNAVVEVKYAELVGEPSPLLPSMYPNLAPTGGRDLVATVKKGN